MPTIFRTLLAAALVFSTMAAVSMHALAQDGPTTQEIDVEPFTEIDIHSVGLAVITQGETPSLTITGDPDVIERITAEVDDDGQLEIDYVWWEGLALDNARDLQFDITVQSLDYLELEGAIQAEADGLSADEFEINLSGATSLTLTNLAVSNLEVEMDGAATAILSGTADHQDLDLDGATTYTALDLDSATADIDLDGASTAQLRVSDQITGEMDGASTLEYIGEDVSVNVDTSGAATVSQLPFTPISGGDGAATPAENADQATDQQAGEELTVTIQDHAFNPPTLEVAVGTTVTWINNDNAPHTATEQGGGFNSGRLSRGDSFSFTFTEPGTYNYICSFHPRMSGTIIVS